MTNLRSITHKKALVIYLSMKMKDVFALQISLSWAISDDDVVSEHVFIPSITDAC